MATKTLNLRTVLDLANDRGETSALPFDQELTLAGFQGVTHRRFTLGNAAVDQAVVVASNACLVFLFSHDYPFSLRLGAAETPMQGLREFVVQADDIDEIAYPAGSLLLSGNAVNDSDIELLVLDTVT